MKSADKKFTKKLNNVLPKIAFISQCYTERLGESYLIHKLDSNIARFRYSRGCNGVNLYFDNNSLEALTILNKEQNISNEFFYYWNDMLNSTGYSSKLLLICSSLEALAKSNLNLTYDQIKRKPNKTENKKIRNFIETKILGKRLGKKLYANQDVGIRHRLTHGSYFSQTKDKKENYLNQIYEKVIQYFNKNVLKKSLIESITNPQRSPYGNKEGYTIWLKSETSQFDLKELVNECDKKRGIDNIENFEILSDSDVEENY